MVATVAVEFDPAHRNAEDVPVCTGQKAGKRVHPTVVIHGMTDDPAAVCISLGIDDISIGAAEFRLLTREIAGRIGVFGTQAPATYPRRTPGLESELPEKFGRKPTRLILANPLGVENEW